MRWTCPKCGKKLEISDEQLIANDGMIVCPQCLLQARQPIPKRQRPKTGIDTSLTTDKPNTPPNKSQKSTPTSTPPPHKQRMKQASTPYRYTGLSGDNGGNTQRPATKKKTTGKKKPTKKKKKTSDGMSALGCLGRTIVITLVLFAAYIFFGLLLEAIQ